MLRVECFILSLMNSYCVCVHPGTWSVVYLLICSCLSRCWTIFHSGCCWGGVVFPARRLQVCCCYCLHLSSGHILLVDSQTHIYTCTDPHLFVTVEHLCGHTVMLLLVNCVYDICHWGLWLCWLCAMIKQTQRFSIFCLALTHTLKNKRIKTTWEIEAHWNIFRINMLNCREYTLKLQ